MAAVFVIPRNDTVMHDEESADCICGPSQSAVFHEDGSVDWVVTHHALDGRE